MDVGTDLPSDTQPAEVVRQGEGLLYDPALFAQTGAVLGTASGDQRANTQAADLLSVLVVVVAPIGENTVGAPTRPHEQDALQRQTVVQALTAWPAGPPLLLRQRRFDDRPRLVVVLPRLQPRHLPLPQPSPQREIRSAMEITPLSTIKRYWAGLSQIRALAVTFVSLEELTNDLTLINPIRPSLVFRQMS